MSIEQRLEYVERGVRRWKMIAAGLAVTLLAICGIAANGSPTFIPAVLHARCLEIVNDNGVTVARIGQVNGNGGLALYGQDGELEFVVGMTADGEAVSLLDGKHQLVGLRSSSDNRGTTVTGSRFRAPQELDDPSWTPPRPYNALRDDPYFMQND